MTLFRFMLLCIVGFFAGHLIASCSKLSLAQTPKNEVVTLNSNNTAVFRGVIEGSSVLKIQLRIAKLVAMRGLKSYPIYLVLDSPGGNLEAGSQLIEFCKIIPDLRTITVFGASMAAVAVELLPGERLITGNGELMFHRAAAQVSGQIEVGELESRMASLKELVLSLETSVAKRLSLSVVEYKAKIKNELWLSSSQALKERAVDKIIDISCSEELVDSRISMSLFTIFGEEKVIFSGCPTLRSPID